MKGALTMKCNVIIDKDRAEEVTVVLNEPSPIADEIRAICAAEEKRLFAYDERGAVNLSLPEVYAFTVSEGKTVAVMRDSVLRLRERLYEVEAIVGSVFVRINQSCLINVGAVKRFSASFGGSLRVEMKNGFSDYVSRRQLKAVKERMGL